MKVQLDNGKTVEVDLTQDAYVTGGSFPTAWGMYNGEWYEAHAEDEDGNEYIVRWTDVNWGVEDEGDACDWDNPDYVQEI